MKIENLFILSLLIVIISADVISAERVDITGSSWVYVDDPDTNYGWEGSLYIYGQCSYLQPNTGCVETSYILMTGLVPDDATNLVLHLFIGSAYDNIVSLTPYPTSAFVPLSITWNTRGLLTDIGATPINFTYIGEQYYDIPLPVLFTGVAPHGLVLLNNNYNELDIAGDESDFDYKPYFTYDLPVQQCTFIDFSECNFYDLGCYFRVLLHYMYYAPGCYFTMLLNSLYALLYNIVFIPIGLIISLFGGLMLCVTDLFGMITDIIALGGSIIGLITNTIGALFPSVWTTLIILGVTLVILLRIYSFLKDISILGFKI